MDARTGPSAAHGSDLSLDELERLDALGSAGDGDGEHGAGGQDDDLVLPWWQHPVNIVTLVVTAAILAGMIGWLVGDDAARIDHGEVDTGFLQDMREHHEQAVYMGFLYRGLDDTDPGLRTVAAGIVRGQSIEVGRMIQLLRDFDEPEANEGATSMAWMGMSAPVGSMPGMASEEELERLTQLSGAAADELFVELMTEHHEGGIHMAEFAAERADNDEVRAMAASMADSQADEIIEMRNLLG